MGRPSRMERRLLSNIKGPHCRRYVSTRNLNKVGFFLRRGKNKILQGSSNIGCISSTVLNSSIMCKYFYF